MIKWLARHQRFTIVLALLVIIGGQASGWLPVAKIARVSTRPLAVAFTKTGLGVGGWLTDVFRISKLAKQNQQLQTENADLRSQLSQLQSQAQENTQLRAQLEFGDKTQMQSLGATVIGYQPDGVRELVLVNRGSKDGVRVGQPAMSGGHLVGVVKETFNTTSQIQLVTDPDFRALVTTQSSRAPGIAKGQAGASLAVERIPLNQALQVGETVITSGLDGSFPIGLPVGQIIEVAPSAEAIFQTARLKPGVDLNQLRAISIILEP